MAKTVNADREVLDLKLDIYFFNEKLKSVQLPNTMDLQMIEQLQTTVEIISKLLANPVMDENSCLDLSVMDEFQLHRQLYCKDCNMAIKATTDKIANHIDSPKHKKVSKTRPRIDVVAPVLAPLAVVANVNGDISAKSPLKKKEEAKSEITKLNKKAKTFLKEYRLENYANKLLQEGTEVKTNNSHKAVTDSIVKALTPSFPQVKVYPFGSRLTGLGCQNSDLDLFIDINFSYFNAATVINAQTMLKVEEALRATKQWANLFKILGARTPIIQGSYIPSQIECDLSFSNGLSHCNTKLITYFVEVQPLFAKVATIAKFYAHEADFKMNSYIIVMLVAFYFQTENLLPAVCLLQSDLCPQMIGPWQSNFKLANWPTKSTDFRKFLIGFFDFYHKFDFKNNVVCPFIGKALKKAYFNAGNEQLPKEFRLYMDYIGSLDHATADPLVHLFAYDKDMVVQDPFELCHNIAKGVRKSSLDRFTSYCRLTAELLKSKKVF